MSSVRRQVRANYLKARRDFEMEQIKKVMKDKALAERELSRPKPAIVVADLPPQPEVIEEVVEESKADVLSQL